MSTFSIGDYVKITPTPDKFWGEWTPTHSLFCSKVGRIDSIIPSSKYGEKYNVSCNFQGGLNGAPPGFYYIDFLSDHLILSSKYNNSVREHQEKVVQEQHEWEKFSKKATDDILRKIFSPEPKATKQKKYGSDIPQPIDWEDSTQEVLIPLPGYKSQNDEEDEDLDYYYPTQDDFFDSIFDDGEDD